MDSQRKERTEKERGVVENLDILELRLQARTSLSLASGTGRSVH